MRESALNQTRFLSALCFIRNNELLVRSVKGYPLRRFLGASTSLSGGFACRRETEYVLARGKVHPSVGNSPFGNRNLIVSLSCPRKAPKKCETWDSFRYIRLADNLRCVKWNLTNNSRH